MVEEESRITWTDDKGIKHSYIMDWEAYKLEQLWFKFKEHVLYMTGFYATSETIQKAEEYLFDKYPEYKVFENK